MTASEIKAALVEAHRSGDQEAMRRLSQEKERLKKAALKAPHPCPGKGCGVIIKGARRCGLCSRKERRRGVKTIGPVRTVEKIKSHVQRIRNLMKERGPMVIGQIAEELSLSRRAVSLSLSEHNGIYFEGAALPGNGRAKLWSATNSERKMAQ